MSYYRLKHEAVEFFDEKHATQIKPLGFWEGMGLDLKALEKVEEAYITYGHQNDNDGKFQSSHLSGWDVEKGQHFRFTINFPSVKFEESDRFSNGKVVRELMERIQSNINHFMRDYYESK